MPSCCCQLSASKNSLSSAGLSIDLSEDDSTVECSASPRFGSKIDVPGKKLDAPAKKTLPSDVRHVLLSRFTAKEPAKKSNISL